MIVPSCPSRHGFLCQLGSIQAASDVAYPWCNLADSLTANEVCFDEANKLVFADMGRIDIDRDNDGKPWSESETY